MKRRDFSIQLAGAGFGLALGSAAQAQGGPIEGQQYVRLSPPASVTLPPGREGAEVLRRPLDPAIGARGLSVAVETSNPAARELCLRWDLHG